MAASHHQGCDVQMDQKNPWLSPENHVLYFPSDHLVICGISFFIVPYLLNSKCSFIIFIFWFHFFSIFWYFPWTSPSKVFSAFHVLKEIHKIYFFNIGSLEGTFKTVINLGKILILWGFMWQLLVSIFILANFYMICYVLHSLLFVTVNFLHWA